VLIGCVSLLFTVLAARGRADVFLLLGCLCAAAADAAYAAHLVSVGSWTTAATAVTFFVCSAVAALYAAALQAARFRARGCADADADDGGGDDGDDGNDGDDGGGDDGDGDGGGGDDAADASGGEGVAGAAASDADEAFELSRLRAALRSDALSSGARDDATAPLPPSPPSPGAKKRR